MKKERKIERKIILNGQVRKERMVKRTGKGENHITLTRERIKHKIPLIG